LKSLQPDARVLVIILEAEAILIGGHQVIFEGCFQNTNEGQMVSRLSNEVFACINHLVAEIGAIYYYYFYILVVCCCCWRKTGLTIDDRVVMKFINDKKNMGLDKA
jgi:hypothetical protein